MERHVEPSDDRLGNTDTGITTYLTPRQAQVLRLAANGLTDKQIATRLAISVRTVQDRFTELRRRTGTRTRGELLAYAVAAGLVVHLASEFGGHGHPPEDDAIGPPE